MSTQSSRGFTAAILFAALASSLITTSAQAQWRHGIGTGIFAINAKGDEGIGTQLLGPVEFELDLSSSDFADVMDSAVGLAGFSTNGTWTIYYSGGQLKLEDSSNGATAGGVPVSVELDFEVTNAELVASYQFANAGRNKWGLIGGINYTSHTYDVLLTAGATAFTREIDNDWTDVLIGLTHTLGFSERTSWTNRLDAGFGGSEGAFHVRTAINWNVGASKSWLLSLYADYKMVDFENGSPDDVDWYLYDVDEFGPGFGFAYMF
jgi:hypothetical protein